VSQEGPCQDQSFAVMLDRAKERRWCNSACLIEMAEKVVAVVDLDYDLMDDCDDVPED
jgi:hypothetical protein